MDGPRGPAAIPNPSSVATVVVKQSPTCCCQGAERVDQSAARCLARGEHRQAASRLTSLDPPPPAAPSAQLKTRFARDSRFKALFGPSTSYERLQRRAANPFDPALTAAWQALGRVASDRHGPRLSSHTHTRAHARQAAAHLVR
ncbi:uncharacterized protein PSFLO_01948 [Pseudozyma flocculosa]|uniref:Uncharacterized protein n=1 Tax=Pseudozyma flocculosa TaxID=84751 RepID=A0A5C3EYK5_9BASI|nr:uncharacterized protein PSFLO_01948 [Pseudozyma flocculosa]